MRLNYNQLLFFLNFSNSFIDFTDRTNKNNMIQPKKAEPVNNVQNQFSQAKYEPPLVLNNSHLLHNSSLQLSQTIQNNQSSKLLQSFVNSENPQLNESLLKQSKISEMNQSILLNSSLQISTIKVRNLDEQIKNYFEGLSTKLNNFQERKQKFINVTTHKIRQQLKNGELLVSTKSKQLYIKNDKEKEKKKELKMKKQIEDQKEEIIHKLKLIQQQEKILNHNFISQHQRSIKKPHIKVSQPEDDYLVKEKLRQIRQFQKSMKNKNDQLLRYAQKMNEKEERQKQRYYLEQNKIKQQKIIYKLRQLQMKSQERKQFLERSRIKEKIKYSHKELQRKFIKQERIKQKEHLDLIKQITQKNKKSISELKNHEKEYLSSLEKRNKDHKDHGLKKKMSKSVSLPKIQSNYFSKLIQEEIFQRKANAYEKFMKIKAHQVKKKINKFQEKVDLMYQPKIKQSRAIPIIPRTQSLVKLTKQQRVQKGLEYLQKAKSLKKDHEELMNKPKAQSPPVKVYKDYLKDQTKKRSQKDATKEQYKDIMQHQIKDFDELIRAKYLSEGLQAKKKLSGDNKIYYSIKRKLSLLQNLC